MTRLLLPLGIVICLNFLSPLSAAQESAAIGDGSVQEKRVMALSQQLRCLVCQNETLADSHAELAADLRNEIREQINAGRSDKEITTFLTDRYGDFILYSPPVKPATYLLWFGPFLILGVGLLTLYRFLKHRSALIDAPLSAEDRKRAGKLLGEVGKGTT